MKKIFIAVLVLSFPLILNASWYNPLSWFDWLHRSDPAIQVLQDRITELESKIATSSPTVVSVSIEAPKIVQTSYIPPAPDPEVLVQKQILDAKTAAEAQLKIDQANAEIDAENQARLQEQQRQQAAQDQANQKAAQDQSRENSSECIQAKEAYNQNEQVMQEIRDNLARLDSSSSQAYALNARQATLAVNSSKLQSDYYRICENYYSAPPSLTICSFVGNSIICQ